MEKRRSFAEISENCNLGIWDNCVGQCQRSLLSEVYKNSNEYDRQLNRKCQDYVYVNDSTKLLCEK